MKIFPIYTRKQRKEETGSALGAFLVFVAICVVSVALFLFGGAEFPPSEEGAWSTIRWGALLVAAFTLYLSLQAFFELAVAATIGPERFLVLFVLVGAACGLGALVLRFF